MIGTAVLESCSYILSGYKLDGVFIEFTSSSNARAIKETFPLSYGEGAPSGKLIEYTNGPGAW